MAQSHGGHHHGFDDGHEHDHAHGGPGAGLSHAGHDHGAGGHVHGNTDRRRVFIAAVLTGAFMVAEALGGWITGSLALIADAGHMLTDSVALWLAWYAFRLGDRPATKRMSYGFGRVKTLVAYTNGITIFAVALWICYEAALRFMAPPPVLAGPMLVVAITGLLINVISFAVLHGGDRSSLNMRGALLHVLGDMLGSAGAIVAALIILATGWTPIDPILSVLVAVLILSTGWRLMKEAAHVLLEGVPQNLDSDAIVEDLEKSVTGVSGIHHVHVWSIDGSSNMATLHARLGEGIDPQGAVAAIKARLATRHGIAHATVEPEYGHGATGRPAHLH